MEKVQAIWSASILGRFFAAISAWCGRQWQKSHVVTKFLTPSGSNAAISDHSLVTRCLKLLHGRLHKLYTKLKLDKIFSGSIFLQVFLWALLPVALSPLLPTMAVLGLSMVGYISLFLVRIRQDSLQPAHNATNRYIALYAFIYLAATFLSVTRSGSLKIGLLTVALLLFCLVLQSAVTTKKQLQLLISTMIVIATVVSLFGLYQYLFQAGYNAQEWVDSAMFDDITFRVSSTMQNPNMLGQYLILMIPLAVASILSSKTWGKTIFWTACCGIMLLCIVLTFSRGAWLGLLFAACIFLVLLSPRLILLAPVLLILAFFLMPDTVITRFTSIGDMTDASTTYRVYIWLGVLGMLKYYWLCGVGPGEDAFNVVYPAFSYNGVDAPHAHNLFLQMICDAGIAALIVFLLILFHYVRTLAISLRKSTHWRGRLFQSASIASIGGFLVQGMTDYSFYNYRLMFTFWIFLAVGSLIARRDELSEGGILQ